jgi:DNA-dependent RNA polymerase auxiliary subunit epsilon
MIDQDKFLYLKQKYHSNDHVAPSREDINWLISYVEQLQGQLSNLCPIGDLPIIDSLLAEKQYYIEYVKKLENMLEKLLDAACALERDYSAMLSGKPSSLTDQEYNRILDVFLDTESYFHEVTFSNDILVKGGIPNDSEVICNK